MQLNILLLAAFEIFFINLVTCNTTNNSGIYTIIASPNIRPYSDYQLSISIHNQSEPIKVRVAVKSKEIKYKNVREIDIQPNSTRMVSLHFEQLNVFANHRLFVEGLSGLKFKHNASMSIETKNVSIFIESDKGMYKPGEAIKFRVLLLNWQLKPVELNTDLRLLIHIMDPENNRIKQWINPNLIKGVFSGEFRLSKLPVIGQWKIFAQVNSDEKSKLVQVAEYELPKFSVKIDSPKHFTVKDGLIRAIIRTQYTYGKSVKGKATVKLNAIGMSYGESDITFQIDGKRAIEFAIGSSIKNLFNSNNGVIECQFEATVIDDLTGKMAETKKQISLYENRYKISTDVKDFQYRVGHPIKFRIAVTHFDDTPILALKTGTEILVGKYEEKRSLQQTHQFNTQIRFPYVLTTIPPRHVTTKQLTYEKYYLNENGTVNINLASNEKGFNVYIKYKDEDKDIGYFSPLQKKEIGKFTVNLLTKKPKLNEDIILEVEAKEPLDYFMYHVISRKKIIFSDTVKVPHRSYHVFQIPATFDLLPSAKLIAYFFENGMIVSAKVDININSKDVKLSNFIKLKLSKNQIRPSENISISVFTNPNSYVGLVGVDQSVILLKENNDLTIENAIQEINQYHNEHIVHRLTHSEQVDDLESSGTIMFTNAKKPVQIIPIYPMYQHYSGISASFAVQSAYSPSSNSAHRTTTMLYAEPMAFTQPALLQSQPPPQVRKEFPETWLWESITDNEFNGKKILERKVPDTITSWVISAFSVDSLTGLGLIEKPKLLEVFQPFFVSVNLPFSVIRGEIVSVPIVLHNYLNEMVEAEITVHNEDGDFEFIDKVNNTNSNLESKIERKLRVFVYPEDGISLNVSIQFKRIGSIGVKVTAISAVAGDSIVKVVQVRAEGVTQYNNKPVLIDLRELSTFKTVIPIDIPSDIIPDSLKVDVNCIGDILGTTLTNIQSLIRLPSGCGEQNMLNFVPNIIILNYLKATSQLSPYIENKIKSYTEIGYQGQLSYRHSDGSFSVFGKSDQSGSTWLTAFIAKSFRQAAEHINIDENIIASALKWLHKVQAPDGSFFEKGQVSHREMQGGAGKGVALTSYVLLAFLENKKQHPQYQSTIDDAIWNIVKNIKEIDDLYILGIAAYALQLADYAGKNEVLNNLVNRATIKDGVSYWSKTAVPMYSYFGQSKTLNIEITSYGLLALLEANKITESFPYFKWLLSQRNDQGGFEGTQDTVVGLQALAKFATTIPSKINNMSISIMADFKNKTNLFRVPVNAENSLILQKFELPWPMVKSVEIFATGHGFALIDLSYRYNLNNTEKTSAFVLKPRLMVAMHDNNDNHINLEVCLSYNFNSSRVEHSNSTNMVVVEVTLPSGYATDSSNFDAIWTSKNVKKIETKNGDTVIVVYFDGLNVNESICPIFRGFKVQKVTDSKPVPIIVYEYYDSSRRSRTFYTKANHTNCQGVFCSISIPDVAKTMDSVQYNSPVEYDYDDYEF